MRRIGHKGADLIEPGNTLASFDAALAHGVDMIELDVLPERPGTSAEKAGRDSGRLVLAHDYEDAAKREPLTLEEGLAHFAGEAYADVELDVDLKLPGYEREVVAGVRDRGLQERSLVSTQYLEAIERLR